MSATDPIGTTTSRAWQGETLVPVMPVEGGAPDPVELATWHLALSASTAEQVPHDLFALWLFPPSGGAVLLGPEALAQDHVKVPLPSPKLLQDELYQLEEVLRRAKYASAMAVPIREETGDVGVMLLGSFARGAFGPGQAVSLIRLAARLGPAMARLAAAMPSGGEHAALEPQMTREALPEHLGRAACESVSSADLIRRVSGILYPLLPHDRLEILVPGAGEGSFVPLSGNAPRRRWRTGGGGVEPYAGIIGRFGPGPTLLLEDLAALESESEWSVGGGSPPSLPARSVLGVRFELGGEVAGYLLLGSVARDAYRPADEESIALTGLLLAPRVAGLRLAERETGPPEAVPARELALRRAAAALAQTAHLGEGLASFAAQLNAALPHHGISVQLRWGEDQVIALDPAAPRPFADLPVWPLEEVETAAVLTGESDWLIRNVEGDEELAVPLWVAGRILGSLGVRSSGFAVPEGAAAIARAFADVLAPHLELLRRGAATRQEVGGRR